jgi:transposase
MNQSTASHVQLLNACSPQQLYLLAAVSQVVDELVAPSLIVIESTGQYHLMAHDAICAAGLNICVINPQVIAALIRAEGKSDARDASTLARLAASFPLRGSNMPDELQRELRLMFKRHDEAKDWERRCFQRLWGHLAACGSPWPRLVSTGSQHARNMLAAQVRGESTEEIMAHYRGGAPRKCVKPSSL